MTFINNLSMRGKLITLVLPALLVIVFFAFMSISRNMDDLRNMHQLQTMVQLATATEETSSTAGQNSS